jgi:hypothetical protein
MLRLVETPLTKHPVLYWPVGQLSVLYMVLIKLENDLTEISHEPEWRSPFYLDKF